MRQSRIAWKFLLAVAACALATLAGCKPRQAAPPPSGNLPEPPLDRQIEQKLDPLTERDVELYLKVMRAAAERVKNPAPGDQKVLEDARKIIASRSSGRIPTLNDVNTLERANLVAISMDQIVAQEMKLDARTYRGIVEAIEAVVPNPAIAPPANAAAPAPDHALTPLEKRLKDVDAANRKFLAPYREEIQKLIAIVRDPANLPDPAHNPH
ncbi:MAG TPA: hypothetical protein VNI36_09550 [Candidatus Dormibacteraeota bacterium]|nr:hypothetical protein [Candidatus Dormibacteraeota bacterium]